MALYEHLLIARQDISAQQVDALATHLKTIVEGEGGKVEKQEYWGLRGLAYRIKKNRKGHYVLLNINAPLQGDRRARAPEQDQRGRAALHHREGRWLRAVRQQDPPRRPRRQARSRCRRG